MDRLGDYWDRDGRQLTLREWATLLEDRSYRQLAATRGAGVLVSTIWLGLNHSYGYPALRLIFESMVFDRTGRDLDMDRYATEASALRGHGELVRRFITVPRRHIRAGVAIGVGFAVLAFALIAASTGGVT